MSFEKQHSMRAALSVTVVVARVRASAGWMVGITATAPLGAMACRRRSLSEAASARPTSAGRPSIRRRPAGVRARQHAAGDSKRGAQGGSEDQATAARRAGSEHPDPPRRARPSAARCAGPSRPVRRAMVEATIRDAKSGSSDLAAKRAARCLRLHRLKRRKTLFRRAPPAHHARASRRMIPDALDDHPVVAPGRALLVRPADDERSHPIPSGISPNQAIHHAKGCLPKSSLESRSAPIRNP